MLPGKGVLLAAYSYCLAELLDPGRRNKQILFGRLWKAQLLWYSYRDPDLTPHQGPVQRGLWRYTFNGQATIVPCTNTRKSTERSAVASIPPESCRAHLPKLHGAILQSDELATGVHAVSKDLSLSLLVLPATAMKPALGRFTVQQLSLVCQG